MKLLPLWENQLKSMGKLSMRSLMKKSANGTWMNLATRDNPELKLVIAFLDIGKLPNKKDRFTRIETGETFFITQISTSTGNVEIEARNETKLNAKK